MAAFFRRCASLFLLAAVVQGTAGCGEITTDAFSKWERMRDEFRERRNRNDDSMRRQMAAGAFGRELLLPASNFKSPASFGQPSRYPFHETVMRLPSRHDVPVAALNSPFIEIRRGDRATGGGVGASGSSGGSCVYKPVMTAEDIATCR